jgi:hypothetical protein
VYQEYIVSHRHLLLPQNIRETKGGYFTPAVWVKKAQEYLAKVFGDDWQDEYYIWDCAAGTGNLLEGLTNKYNVWASDIDQANVDTMLSLIDMNDSLNLLPAHVFQFDFLNDFVTQPIDAAKEKLPYELRKIINDPVKREKLIVLINPPYAEAGTARTPTGTGENKTNVAKKHDTSALFMATIGRAINELFAQFFCRVYQDIPGCCLAAFSTLKYINSPNFSKFRAWFKAGYKGGFVCPADTFNNMKGGKFPIGFLIWDLKDKQPLGEISADVFDIDSTHETAVPAESKRFFPEEKGRYLSDWLKQFYDTNETNKAIGYLTLNSTDMQHNHFICISSTPTAHDVKKHMVARITTNNLIEICVYLTVRHVISHTWLNDRDQFLFPNDGWKSDAYFQNNCLVFTLFYGQNRISATDGVNNWLPFTPAEVDAKEKFESDFMADFLKERIKIAPLSAEAKAVLDAGRTLWRYYHAAIKNKQNVSVNASFYDIRAFFQGRDNKGRMNNGSSDEGYNTRIAALREAHRALNAKIVPKVYEYGFLRG